MNRIVQNQGVQLLRANKRKLFQGRQWRSSSSYKRYDDGIVISGISGRFPSSENMEIFKENLLNGVDMVKDQTRWTSDRIPKRCGFLDQLDKFDAMFFGIIPKLADCMDPSQRMLLEVTFEAIVDAGINPQHLKNTKTGVFVGALGGEASDYRAQKVELDSIDGYGALGVPNFMLPNRLSYEFNFHGPSFLVSTGCSSSLVALEAAVNSIRLGKCDAAIVAGTCLHLNSSFFMDLLALNAVSPDGKCQAFDYKGNGFVRSEAVTAILVQKAKDARRSYATIKSALTNSDGYKEEGLVHPSGAIQEILIRDACTVGEVDPGSIKYVEAHGTGTPVGDPQEIGAVYRTLVKAESRNEPLLIGSVKTNMGHGESAAGICSIAKIAVMTQTKTIPANLHFERLNPALEPYFDGSLEVVTKPTPFDGGLVGISSFGLGGTNAHLILETNAGTHKKPETELPILIPISGRTQENVELSLKDAEKHGSNLEFATLLQNAYQEHIPGNGYRGYSVISPGQSTSTRKVENCEGLVDRPVWVVFPGMGSQWNEMGKDMMKIDTFAESMLRSKATLKNIGMELDELLKPNNQAIFNDIRNAFVSIAAVQIALYDTLKSLGIKPQGFIGHSAGEALCAYADGCTTAEETILMNEARGRAFVETLREPLAMASVGLSWSEIASKCPPNVYPACNNAAHNVSVAGSAPAIQDFVKQLQGQGIFAKEVNSCNTAPHSPYMTHAGELLHQYISEIIPDKRQRSPRWISTSIQENEWNGELAKYCSADYIVNNLLNKVRFYDALQKIPEKSLVLEVGPKGLFQAILKESVPSSCVHVAPMHPKAEDKVGYFMQCVGNMYTSGVDVKIDELYPKVSFPVSADTPFTGPLVRWDHEKSWKTSVMKYPTFDGKIKSVDLQDAKDKFLEGHRLDDRIVFPATGYLVMAWKNYANTIGIHHEKFPVLFSNISLERATFLTENKPTELTFSMLDGGKSFEIKEEGAVVVRGNIAHVEESTKQSSYPWLGKFQENMSTKITLNTEDIYKELRLRGYNYSGEFRGIQKIDTLGTQAEIAWKGNWVTLLDTALQTVVLKTMTRNTLVPVRLQEVFVDPKALFDYISTTESDTPDGQVTLPVNINSNLDIVECPGIHIKGLTATVIPRKRNRETLAFEAYSFRPHFGASCSDGASSAVAQLVDLMLENSGTKKLKVLDVFADKEQSIADDISNAFLLKPQHQMDMTLLTLESEVAKMDDKFKSNNKIVAKESMDQLVPESPYDLICLNDVTKISGALENSTGYVLLKSSTERPMNLPENVSVISSVLVDEHKFSLLRNKLSTNVPLITNISIDGSKFEWLETVKQEMAKLASVKEPSRLYLSSQKEADSGILGLVNCLRQEPGGENVRCIFDPQGKLSLNFQNPDPMLASILGDDLAINVIKNGELGSYRHLPLSAEGSNTKLVEHAYINTLTTGDLTSLRWIESPLKYETSVPEHERCKVAFAAMNFRDVMLATGKLPIDASSSHRDCVMGFEFSGYDSSGKRVMGMTSSKALATSVLLSSQLVWPIPQSWTLEDAATVPIVYSTAYYAMFNRGRLSPGQSILIHSGTGGVGQAAISIALANDCEVFTTVGTEDKRDYILKLFPALKPENVGNSRDCSFEELVMTRTNGKGVDAVLNSLSEEKLQASIRCLGINGKFLEIGAFDASQNNPLGMSSFLKNTEFHGIYLTHVFDGSKRDMDMLRDNLMDGIEKGVVKPLPRHTFKRDQIEEAFRFMASGKHTGKVVIQVRDEALGPDQPVTVPAIPRTYFHPQKTYVIIGGLGGLGLEVAAWLVERGARNLVLPSRSGVTTGYQALCLRKWTDRGVNVQTPKIDLTDPTTCDNFFFDLNSNKGDPLGGIFNSSLVLRDAMIENQTLEAFQEVCAPKIGITKRLDELTREHTPELDYFVAFSSGASGRGNAGQTNYGFANSVMERLCEQRVNDGLHGLAIQWGVIGEVGFVAEKMKSRAGATNEIFEGTLPQSVQSCIDVLDAALQQNNPVCSSMIIADKQQKTSNASSLIQRMIHIFGIKDISKISDQVKLTDMGMDSLIAIELKQTLEREFDLPLTTPELRSLTFGDLRAIDAGSFSKDKAGTSTSNKTISLSDLGPLRIHDDCVVHLNPEVEATESLFIVHGVEGCASVFQQLATSLTVNAYGLQFTKECAPEDVSQIAEIYTQKILQIQPTGPFSIAGYSAGGTIAHTIAKKLETEHNQEVQNIIFLDGTCDWIGDGSTSNSLFSSLINTFPVFESMDESVKNAFLSSLNSRTYEENTKQLTEIIKSVSSIEPEALEILMTYLNLSIAVQKYSPTGVFKGNTTLVKASGESVMNAFNDPNFNLKKTCKGEFQCHSVDGNHSTFLKNPLVSEIINQTLRRQPIRDRIKN